MDRYGQGFGQGSLKFFDLFIEFDKFLRGYGQEFRKGARRHFPDKAQKGASLVFSALAGLTLAARDSGISCHQISGIITAVTRGFDYPGNEFMSHDFWNLFDEHAFPIDMKIRTADATIEDSQKNLSLTGNRISHILRAHITYAVVSYCFHTYLL
jgi:hypothetical protein